MTNLFDEIDDVDRQIISLLQEDADISYTAIGQKLDKSQHAIGARVLKLSRSGILGTQKGVNFKTSGLPLMSLDIRSSDAERMMKRAEVCPFILNAFKKLGESNFQLLVTASNIEAINEIIDDCYRKDETIQSIKSSLHVSMNKDFILPVNFNFERYEGYNCPLDCPFNTNELPFSMGYSDPILEKIARRDELKKHFDNMLYSIKEITQCDGIGIRLADREGKIKFYVWKGLSDEFYVKENDICVEECVCGRVAMGKCPQGDECFTGHGSFISNNITDAAERIVEKELMQPEDFRGECLRSGVGSLALIPIRNEEKVFGLLYISSPKNDLFSPALSDTLESFSNLLGNYLQSIAKIR